MDGKRRKLTTKEDGSLEGGEMQMQMESRGGDAASSLDRKV